jgi:DNA polymerase I-like protein with 3'-5' exonuclease and polymerase domains
MPLGLPFREVIAIDFEFTAGTGENPQPVCLVAKEVGTGRLIRLWEDQLGPEPPFEIDDETLFVAYYAPAEVGCFLALGWPVPTRLIDLFAEYRRETNALAVAEGRGLLSALSRHHITRITSEEKKSGRDLVLRGGPWTDSERRQILDYCETDVICLPALLEAMLPGIAPNLQGLGRALLRGRYMAAVARMEQVGVPVDTKALSAIRDGWELIKSDLIEEVDANYGVFENGVFKSGLFAKYLADRSIAWPKTETGRLVLDQDTFKDMAKIHPELAPLRELRHSLSELRLEKLDVGSDGRNRTMLSPFGASSGRNTPSANRFIFGPSVWLRGLIKPGPGMAIAYIDWSSQEVAIAAALSGDTFLMDSVASGDPYLSFAVRAGLAPEGATKASHGVVRDVCKACVLGTNYGMGAKTLAFRTGTSVIEAEALLRMLARTYPVFTAWQSKSVDVALLRGHMSTVFGWKLNVTNNTRPTALRNFPMQSHGAEMLRIACCLATERGISVCAPVHDALLIEAPIDLIDDAVASTRGVMAEAAAAVLGTDVWIDTDVSIVKYPDRYSDRRGQVMWDQVMSLLDRHDLVT